MNEKANADNSTKMNINWYPGHMAKTKRLIKENLNLIDIIYEVIDARIPISSKIKDIDELINNKPRILIITKYDLCDKQETDKFISYYEDLGYYVLPYNLNNSSNIDDIYNLSLLILRPKILKLEEKGLKKSTIRALVVGIPNAGKSTLINRLVGQKKAPTGNKPGVTKSINWIRVREKLELLDTPGILWPKLEQEKIAYNLASMTAIKEDILPKEDIAVYIINTLYEYYPEKLGEFYDIYEIDDMEYVFDTIGRKLGCLIKGGEIDYDRVADIIINDIKSGTIKNITFDRINEIH